MAIKINGTTVIDDTRNVTNIVSITTSNLSISANVTFDGTAGIILPKGTTAEQPGVGVAGQLRFNTTTGQIEVSDGIKFKAAGGSGGITASTVFVAAAY